MAELAPEQLAVLDLHVTPNSSTHPMLIISSSPLANMPADSITGTSH